MKYVKNKNVNHENLICVVMKDDGEEPCLSYYVCVVMKYEMKTLPKLL
jgi:hypothetical protein